MIVHEILVCSCVLISVCMFFVSKALLISSDTVIVRTGGAIWLNPIQRVRMAGLPKKTVNLSPIAGGGRF